MLLCGAMVRGRLDLRSDGPLRCRVANPWPAIIGGILAVGLVGSFAYRWATGKLMVDDADT